MSDNFNKNRLAKNTILLYVRMLFTMWLNLYTTRLTLANLGVEDMGIYGVVQWWNDQCRTTFSDL